MVDDELMIQRAEALSRLADRILAGEIPDRKALAVELVELTIDLAPVELLRDHLTAEGIRRAELIADAVERAKVGP